MMSEQKLCKNVGRVDNMNTKKTLLSELIKNKICDYEISRTDTKSNKKQLREYLSEYLEIPSDDITILQQSELRLMFKEVEEQ